MYASTPPKVISRTTVPATFRSVRRGAIKNVLAWTDSTGAGRAEPKVSPDGCFVISVAAVQPEKALEANKWVDVELDGDMFVRDSVVLVSPTAALLQVAQVECGAHVCIPGDHIPSSLRIKPNMKLDSLPDMLLVGVFK